MTKPIRRRRKRDAETPTMLSMLAKHFDVGTIARLAISLRNIPGFDNLTEEQGVAELRRLWRIHADAATEYHIVHYSPASRPELWWDGKARPFVRPIDWNDPRDAARFDTERAAADLKYLREHGHITNVSSIVQVEVA